MLSPHVFAGLGSYLIYENRLAQLLDKICDLLSILCLIEEAGTLPLRQ